MRECTLLFVHGSAMGYGRYGVELAKALEADGVDVYDHLDAPEEPHRFGDKLVETGQRSKRTNVVCWVSVPTHARGWWEGQHAAISTMWEATALPESFRETLHEFSTVIVPSDHNVELFSNYHNNVHKVPLGMDSARWHLRERPALGAYFKFLIGGSGARKGTDLAHRAFRKLWGKEGSWGDGPIPVLVMKNPKAERFHGERIEIIGGRISAEAEADLYADAHCYLQPSRGEGFGLQPLQALAQGCPTILTNAHGHTDFAHLGLPLSTTLTKAQYFIYGDADQWWEPDFDELCDHMRWVYDHYDEAVGDAKRASDVIHEQFTWANTARAFCEVFGDELEKPYSGLNNWKELDLRRYLVIVRENWKADIAGKTYFFEAGEEYWEPADVKRILFEGGKLHPLCLHTKEPGSELDLGLTEGQLQHLDQYSASHAHCPTCGSRLNSTPTYADSLYQAMEVNRA